LHQAAHQWPKGGSDEAIRLAEVDPGSPNFGKILADMPLPPDFHNHHIFYNRDSSKASVTGLGTGRLFVLDLKRFPYRLRMVAVPDCTVGEDVVVSEDNTRWFLTCMGSSAVIAGDAVTDKALKTIRTPRPYPHGIAIHGGIDRILITETVSHELKNPGETITVIEASTGKVLSTHKVSNKPSPAGEAPGDRFYLTTANPGQFHIFDISGGPKRPKLLKSIPAAGGAHHVAFTKDWRYAFVQNNLLGLPGMSDASITVIDLQKEQAVASIDTFKNQGLNPNSIVLLPEWNAPAGH
jgi:DNA-binding beta-propeller fold protein YncE